MGQISIDGAEDWGRRGITEILLNYLILSRDNLGSLLFFVFERHTYLAGASGGVYAILAAHVANVIINWSEMEFNWVRAIILGVLIIADAGTAIYQRYFENVETKVSFLYKKSS